MTNLAQHIAEWLTSIGADGLMKPDWEDGPIAITLYDIANDKDAHFHAQLVPAYRHADGTYHTFPTICENCIGRKDEPSQEDCYAHEPCATAQSWISRKGEDNAKN